MAREVLWFRHRGRKNWHRVLVNRPLEYVEAWCGETADRGTPLPRFSWREEGKRLCPRCEKMRQNAIGGEAHGDSQV